MQGFILNKNFEAISLIDIFDSFLWVDRYNLYGDFEISSAVTETVLLNVKRGNYIQIVESNHIMIVENLEINTDYEDGNKIIITGRSLESILDRRIVWKQTVLTGNLQDAIEKLINDAIIAPDDLDRKIPNFIFKKSENPKITEMTIDAQFTGVNLYLTISSICESYGLGFEITLSKTNEFIFELYFGKDRSLEQSTNPYVIFSPSFDNIVDSSYYESERIMKTVTLVAGEGEGLERRTHTVNSNKETKGLERREMYTDARDIVSTVYDENDQGQSESKQITEEEYNALLETRGLEVLSQNTLITTFEGQVEQGLTFTYGEDYFMGDIIQVINDYDMKTRSRVIEIIRSEDSSGSKIYPTFGTVSNKEE